MFYSHEILTSRKYGVATIWLVATLGAKSALKKVTRKAILDVDVTKACETIITPNAPMALRLQSNLLYGVSRVYAQQCTYVLTDAEHAQQHMRVVLQNIQKAALEPEGVTKARAEQLILADDPTFLPDLDILQEPGEQTGLAILVDDLSQLSSLSPRTSQKTISPHSLPELQLPPSVSSYVGGSIGGLDIFGERHSSTRRTEPVRLLDDEDLGLDLGFDTYVSSDHMQPETTTHVRGEQGRPGVLNLQSDQDVLQNIDPSQQDEFAIVDDNLPIDTIEIRPEETTEAAQAPMRRRKRPAPKIIPLDGVTELRSADILQWNQNYLAGMQNILRLRDGSKTTALAKKNAEHWVLGSFLGMGMRGPLDLFSGAKIIEAFTGIDLLQAGQKRHRDENDDVDGGRRVRPRSMPIEERGRGLPEEQPLPMEDDTIEMGRDAPTPLEERRLSSMLPWNQSAGSRRVTEHRSTSISAGGQPLGLLGRRGSRQVSASPLLRHGATAPLDMMDDIQYPMHDTLLSTDDDFELFGPAAQVDTQTAEQSQWQRSALGGEGANFLDFVRTAIDSANEVDSQAQTTGAVPERSDGITFETLLPPSNNSAIVAAQAFLHVLTLGSRNLLQVQQAEDFGDLRLRVQTHAL